MIAAIFDIDGTLTESFGFDGDCYIRAVKEVLGEVHIHDDWGKYEKVTDLGILLQIMKENGIDDSSCIEKIKTRFSEMIQSYLENGGKCHSVTGAIEFLQSLSVNDRVKIGLATGGWGRTAKLKLQHAGFVLKNMNLVSSDDSDERIDIMKKCLNKLGNSFEKILYFGDAKWDLNACNQLGWNFIGVGKRLNGKCDVWIKDFSDQDTICKILCNQ